MCNVIAATAATGFFSRIFADQSGKNLAAPTPLNIVTCIAAGLVLGFLVSLVYIFTHRKVGYTQSMVLTIPMLSTLVSSVMIMMCLLSTEAVIATSVGMTGIFSLVRFRSAPGDPRDIGYIFYGMALGTICGLGFIGYACVIFAILAAAMILFNLIGFAAPKVQDMTLKITIPENLNYNGLFDSVFEKYTTQALLRRVKTTDFGTLFDLIYAVRVRNDVDQKKFIDELRTLNGNLNITLVLYKYDDQIYDTKEK